MGARIAEGPRLLGWMACFTLACSFAFLTGRISGIESATEAIGQHCREDHLFFDGPYEYACEYRGAH